VHVSRFKLALGAMFSDNITIDAHSDKVFTTTFTSIMGYLTDYGMAQGSFTVFEEGSIVPMN
jgi:hypothetical protein